MGLDMFLSGEKYFFTDYKNDKNNIYENGHRLTRKVFELGYWRKHPNLHGFIVQTFAGGKDECQKINLSEVALLRIIDAIKDEMLPDTEGFFFGTSDGTETLQDLDILTAALLWLKAEEKCVSKSVYYRASW